MNKWEWPKSLKTTEDLEKAKLDWMIANNQPEWFYRILCKFNIRHAWLLREYVTHKNGKRLSLEKQYGVEKCIFCGKTRKVK